jgi:hypothetical protein
VFGLSDSLEPSLELLELGSWEIGVVMKLLNAHVEPVELF